MKKGLKKLMAMALCLTMLCSVMFIVPTFAEESTIVKDGVYQVIDAQGESSRNGIGIQSIEAKSDAKVEAGFVLSETVKAVKVTVGAGKSNGLHVKFNTNQPTMPFEGAYLEFEFCSPDAKILPGNVQMFTKDKNGGWPANYYYFPDLGKDADGTVKDGWHKVLIDLDQWYKGTHMADLVSLYQIRVFMTNNTDADSTFYIRDMKITYDLDQTKTYELCRTYKNSNHVGNNHWYWSWSGNNANYVGDDNTRQGIYSYYTFQKEAKRDDGETVAQFKGSTTQAIYDIDVKNITLTGESYLEFWLYSEAFVPTRMQFNVGTGWPGYSFAENGIVLKPDAWNYIRVPIEGEGELKKVWIHYDPNTDDSEKPLKKLYISDMFVKSYDRMKLSAAFGNTEATKHTATLNWTCNNDKVASYNVYKNGELVATVSDANVKTYTDMTAISDPTVMSSTVYKVEAVSKDQYTKLCTPAETTLSYIPNQDNAVEETKIIGSSANTEYISKVLWSSYSWNGSNSNPATDSSRKGIWSYYSFKGDNGYANGGTRFDIQTKNITIEDERYLEFWIYSEKYVPVKVQYWMPENPENAYPGVNFADVGIGLKPDTWNFVRIPINGLGKLERIWIDYADVDDSADGHKKLFVSDMVIKKFDNILTVTGSETGEIAESCKAGETLTVNANLLEGVKGDACIVAELNANKALKNVKMITAEDNTFTLSSDAAFVRVVVWEDANALCPVMNMKTITVVSND